MKFATVTAIVPRMRVCSEGVYCVCCTESDLFLWELEADVQGW